MGARDGSAAEMMRGVSFANRLSASRRYVETRAKRARAFQLAEWIPPDLVFLTCAPRITPSSQVHGGPSELADALLADKPDTCQG